MGKQVGRGPVYVGAASAPPATNVGASNWTRADQPTFEETTDTETALSAQLGVVTKEETLTQISWQYQFDVTMKAGVDPGSIGLIVGQEISVKLCVGETADYYGAGRAIVKARPIKSAAKGCVTYAVTTGVQGDENGTLH